MCEAASRTVACRGLRYARSGLITKVLKVENYSIVPPTNKMVVQVQASPIHRSDAAIINGSAFGFMKKNDPKRLIGAFPRVGGVEGVGIVVQPDVSHSFEVGDLVWMAPFSGSWADKVSVDPAMCHKILPQHRELAVFGTNLLLAQRLLQGFGRLNSGDVVIQNGGSSFTSLAVAALAKQKGLKVFTAALPGSRFQDTVARHAKFNSTVFEYTAKGLRQMREASGPAALLLNGIGGPLFNEMLKNVKPKGFAVTYGAQSGPGLLFSGSHFPARLVTHTGLFIPAYLNSLSHAAKQTQLEMVLEAMTRVDFSYPVSSATLDTFQNTWDRIAAEGGKGILRFS